MKKIYTYLDENKSASNMELPVILDTSFIYLAKFFCFTYLSMFAQVSILRKRLIFLFSPSVTIVWFNRLQKGIQLKGQTPNGFFLEAKVDRFDIQESRES